MMWYVIRTFTGKEDDFCLWINAHVDKSLYTRCFVPLFQDVVRREGVGHILIRKMFDGYLFLETDKPEEVEAELKKAASVFRGHVCYGCGWKNVFVDQ